MVKNSGGAGWRYRGSLIRGFYDSGRGKVIAMKLIRIGLDRQAEVQAIKQARASTEVVTRKSGSDGCAACWKPCALRDSFMTPSRSSLPSCGTRC